MAHTGYREAIIHYISLTAKPPDKFSHQSRLYELSKKVAAEIVHDDDVLFAAAWLHDLGVFVGQRPAQPKALAAWDWIAYAIAKTPALLDQFGFPKAKVPAVIEAIRTHLPSSEPTTIEGVVLRDADMLEQLGAVGILRTASKVGRDTRFVKFSDVLGTLQKNLEQLPEKLRLESTRRLARPRILALEAFLAAAQEEACGVDW